MMRMRERKSEKEENIAMMCKCDKTWVMRL